MQALAVYAAWDARLSAVDDKGTSARAHLEVAARRGSVNARRELDGPVFPDAMAYLWGWYQDISRGLGADLRGIAALTWGELDAWARRTGRDPEPHEVEALFTLDAVTRHPELVEASHG